MSIAFVERLYLLSNSDINAIELILEDRFNDKFRRKIELVSLN